MNVFCSEAIFLYRVKKPGVTSMAQEQIPSSGTNTPFTEDLMHYNNNISFKFVQEELYGFSLCMYVIMPSTHASLLAKIFLTEAVLIPTSLPILG